MVATRSPLIADGESERAGG